MLLSTVLAADSSLVPQVGIGLVIGAVVGALIGNAKNRVVLGLVLGAILGCFGWVIIALVPKKQV